MDNSTYDSSSLDMLNTLVLPSWSGWQNCSCCAIFRRAFSFDPSFCFILFMSGLLLFCKGFCIQLWQSIAISVPFRTSSTGSIWWRAIWTCHHTCQHLTSKIREISAAGGGAGGGEHGWQRWLQMLVLRDVVHISSYL